MFSIISIILIKIIFKYIFPLSQDIDQRMLGGWKVNITEFPYAISLKYYTPNKIYKVSTTKCGGTIISKLLIITAAHCTKGKKEKELFITFGENLFTRHYGNIDRMRNISRIFEYEEFNSTSFQINDIVLLQVDKEIKFSDVAKPINLMKKDEKIQSNYSLVTGFKNFGIKTEKYLMANNVQILEIDECNDTKSWFNERQICGRWTINQTVTQGDSGSALISLRENGEKVLIGIVSFAFNVQDKKTLFLKVFVIFTRVSYYLDWICKNIEISSTST